MFLTARLLPLCLLLLGMTSAVTTSAEAKDCPAGEVEHMALEPVRALVGYNGETRKQFLDRRYPGWQEDRERIVQRIAPTGDEALRLSLTAPAGLTFDRADLVVEAAFEYVERDGNRRERVGHREIARYPLTPDVAAEIAVPSDAFREPGALLVALVLRRTDVAGAEGVMVAALPVELNRCPRRVYTHDRFTAIRLNRREAGSR